MINNEIIESFLNCHYRAYLKSNGKVGNITEFENLESDLLKKNRKEYFDRICSKYREDQILRKFDFKKKKQIKNKCYYIEPLLIRKQYNIRFDALEIIHDKSFPNKISYIPISVSPKEKLSKIEKLSLNIKCLVLKEFYNFTPEHGRIIYGKDLKSTRIAFKTYEKESRKLLKELTKIINNDDAPIFYKNDHCQICEFQKDCRKILVEKDDLSLLGRMSQKEIIKQNNKGIFTVNQFSYLYKPKKYNKKDSKEPQRPEYSLKALALREGKTYILKLPKLNSSKVEIYLDIEGLPDENFCYLIGLVIQNENEKRLSFWADSKEDEKKIFMQLLETVSKFDDFIIYHYGNYEIHFLNKINKKLDNAYDDEIRLIMEKSINILSLFTTAIYPPTYTNELKEIAPFLGFKWSNKNASGIQSIIWRKKWELYDNPEYRSDLVQYNIEDCLALKLIKEWIVAIIKNSNQQDKKEDFVNVEDMKIQGVFRFGNKNYQTPDFELITKCAYFDYQREKIYLKTNKTIKRALKRREKRKKQIDKINKIIETSPKRCPNCRFNQFNEIKRSKRSKIEVNLKFINNGIKKWVTQYNGGSFICKKCRKIFTPHDFKQIHNYGHNLIIWSANQYITHRVSFRRIAEMLQESFNIQAIYSRVFDFKVILAREYKQTYEEIIKVILNSPLIHADETKVTVKGFSSSCYVWVFTTMDSVFYIFRHNREADFLKDLLKGFNGVLVSDYYLGYDSLPCLQQKCLIHLTRDLNDDLFKNQQDIEFKTIVINFGKLLRKIIDAIDKYGLKKRHLNKFKKDVAIFYNQINNKEYESELAISYQKRFQKYSDKLFTFLSHDGIPWNNNNGETAIKPFAEYRKHVDGNFTENGINDYLTLLSIQQTCNYRGISFLEFLKSKELSIVEYSRKH